MMGLRRECTGKYTGGISLPGDLCVRNRVNLYMLTAVSGANLFNLSTDCGIPSGGVF